VLAYGLCNFTGNSGRILDWESEANYTFRRHNVYKAILLDV